MTYDIVTRLREFIDHGIAVGPYHASLAIDEIERLRADRDYYRKIVDEIDKAIQKAVRGGDR